MAKLNEILPLVIQSLVIFTVVLVAILIYILPLDRKRQNLPLCIFLFQIGLHLLTDLTADTPIFNSPRIHFIPSVFIFLYAPWLYIHASRMLEVRLKRLWPHFMLSFIFMLIYLIYGFVKGLFFIVYGLQYLFYLWLSSKLLIENKPKNRIKLLWIRFVFYGFGLIWLFAFAANIFGYFLLENIADIIEVASFFVTIGFVFTLLYFVIVHSNLFMFVKIGKHSQLLDKETLESTSIKRMEQLQYELGQKQIFKNPNLNREEIASLLNLDVQTLSKEINQYFKITLPELINRYRIEEAKNLLKNKSLSIKEIYYEIGFQSRSVFNTAFKKNTGVTPNEYRNTIK